MMASFWALKGGQGTSTTAAMAAVGASADRPALLVDLCADQTGLFRTGPHQRVIAEWSAGPPDRLRAPTPRPPHHRHAAAAAPRPGPIDYKRAEELYEWLIGAHPVEPVIADAGTLDPEPGGEARDHRLRRIAAEVAPASILVTKPCYLALRRGALNPVPPTGWSWSPTGAGPWGQKRSRRRQERRFWPSSATTATSPWPPTAATSPNRRGRSPSKSSAASSCRPDKASKTQPPSPNRGAPGGSATSAADSGGGELGHRVRIRRPLNKGAMAAQVRGRVARQGSVASGRLGA